MHVGMMALCEAMRGSSLHSLDLSSTGLRPQALTVLGDVLAANSALTSLNIAHNALDGEAMKPVVAALPQNTHLVTLDLSGNFPGMQAAVQLLGAWRVRAPRQRCSADAVDRLTGSPPLAAGDMPEGAAGVGRLPAGAHAAAAASSATAIEGRQGQAGRQGQEPVQKQVRKPV